MNNVIRSNNFRSDGFRTSLLFGGDQIFEVAMALLRNGVERVGTQGSSHSRLFGHAGFWMLFWPAMCFARCCFRVWGPYVMKKPGVIDDRLLSFFVLVLACLFRRSFPSSSIARSGLAEQNRNILQLLKINEGSVLGGYVCTRIAGLGPLKCHNTVRLRLLPLSEQ